MRPGERQGFFSTYLEHPKTSPPISRNMGTTHPHTIKFTGKKKTDDWLGTTEKNTKQSSSLSPSVLGQNHLEHAMPQTQA